MRQLNFSDNEREGVINGLHLLTDKPVLYVCNVSESDAAGRNPLIEKVQELRRLKMPKCLP